jgi:hypothetical protein
VAASSEKCPSCGWIHAPTRDRVCTSCHKQLDAPHAYVEPSSRREIDGTLGPRLAGVALVLNVALGIWAWSALSGEVKTNPILFSPVGVVLDLAFGGSLIAGSVKYRGWVVARLLLGLLAFVFFHMAHFEPVELAVQGVFVASILALLLGTPGRVRVGLATLALALVFGLAVAAIAGVSPLAAR